MRNKITFSISISSDLYFQVLQFQGMESRSELFERMLRLGVAKARELEAKYSEGES